MNTTIRFLVCLAMLFIAAGCVTKTQKKTRDKNVSASCTSPQFKRSEDAKQIQIQFVEHATGEREYLEKKCTKYLTLTQKQLADRGIQLAKGKVIGATFATVFRLPFWVLGDVLFLSSERSKKRCQGWKLKETKAFDERLSNDGKFTGKVIFIPVGAPANSRQQDLKDFSKVLSFDVDPSEDEFLLQVKGDYISEKNRCVVDQQILLEPGILDTES